MRTDFIAHSYSYVIGVSDKITHMTMKIAVIPEYADEKKTLLLMMKQVTFDFVANVINCFK